LCKLSVFKHAISAFLFASDNATMGVRRSSGASSNREAEEIGSMQEVASLTLSFSVISAPFGSNESSARNASVGNNAMGHERTASCENTQSTENESHPQRSTRHQQARLRERLCYSLPLPQPKDGFGPGWINSK